MRMKSLATERGVQMYTKEQDETALTALHFKEYERTGSVYAVVQRLGYYSISV